MQAGTAISGAAGRPGRGRAAAVVLAWVAMLAGGLWLLTVTGRGPLEVPLSADAATWRQWLADRDGVTVAFALVRGTALAVGWYLAAITLAGVLARLARSARLIAAADALAVPPLRPLVQAVLGAGVAAASLTVASTSAPPDLPTVSAAALAAPLGDSQPAIALPPPDLPGAGDPTVAVPPADHPGMATPAPPTTWTVQPGDHLWAIAQQVLTQAWGRSPSAAETTTYWARLVERNRGRLTDRGNPDLIHPGQVFELPAVAPQPPQH